MPPTLLDLPPEILDTIAGNLCACETCNPSGQKRNYKSDRTALASLSATCRPCRDLFQPALYHRVYPYRAQVEFCRTIHEREDLGSSVRELYYAHGAYEDYTSRPLYPSVNNHAFEGETVSGLDNFEQLRDEQPGDPSSIQNPGDCFEFGGFTKSCVLEQGLLFLTLCKVPALRTLVLWYDLEDLSCPSNRLPANTLPELRQLRIFSKRDEMFTKRYFPLDFLSLAMPALESFHSHFDITPVDIPSHLKVTELVLSNTYKPYKNLLDIANRLVSLRKFVYTETLAANDLDGLTSCRDICTALAARRDTLEHLTIKLANDAREHRFDPYSERNDDDELHTTCLRRLKALKHLCLNHAALMDLLEDGPDPVVLRDILPPSLQHAEFVLDSSQQRMLRLIARWAPICREQCPDLQAITLRLPASALEDPLSQWWQQEVIAAGVVCHMVEENNEEERRLKAHRLDPASRLLEYDDPPGWEFWDPDVKPMTTFNRGLSNMG